MKQNRKCIINKETELFVTNVLIVSMWGNKQCLLTNKTKVGFAGGGGIVKTIKGMKMRK